MSDDWYHKIVQPFMERNEKGEYIDSRTFGFGKDQCASKNRKKRQCSLAKGHDGPHEHWQFFEDVTNKDLKGGCEYRGQRHEPWELGMRIRVWGD